MSALGFRIGDTMPIERDRCLHYDGPAPCGWYVLEAKPGQQMRGRDFLEAAGVECWWPVRVSWIRNRYRPKQRTRIERPVAPGYVFTQWPGPPRWHRLFDELPAAGYFSRVVSVGGSPSLLNEAQIAAMAQIPERLDRIQQARRDAKRVRPGDRATVIEGVYAGWVVDVGEIRGPMAEILIPLLGKNPKIRAEHLERVVPVEEVSSGGF